MPNSILEVEVNDRVQRGYCYNRKCRPGRDSDLAFSPDLSPAEMLDLGVSCGKYLTDWKAELLLRRFAEARLAGNRPKRALNHFGVNASSPQRVWTANGWVHPDDPRGWLQWYCRYSQVAGWSSRISGKSAAGELSDAPRPKCKSTASLVARSAGCGSRHCCNGRMTAAACDWRLEPVNAECCQTNWHFSFLADT